MDQISNVVIGWTLKPLGMACEVLDKFRKPITKKDRVSGPYPYYGATGILDYVENFIFDERLVLIGEDGAKWGAGENTAFIVEGQYWVNNHAHVVRTDPDMLLDKWITYYLNGSNLSAFITGLTVPKLNQGKLKEIPIPLPPLSEQKRIVATLDKAFAAIDKSIANTEKNLVNARELFESYLNDVFAEKGDGWEETNIKDQFILQRGFDITKKQQIYGTIPVVSSGGIKSHHNTAKAIAPGVVIGRKGSLGTAYYLEEDYWPHDTTLWVKDFIGNNPKLVYYFLKGLDVKGLDSGTANPSLNRNNVHALNVFWPPRQRQKHLVQKIDEMMAKSQHLQSIYQQKLKNLKDLKQSILQKAFAGELTTDPDMVSDQLEN
ncbi:type I restriction enzyme, S subunit [Maridesulfovibrio ferrireducens]|uniref:Type I restriction enzyme, S subunit n=1 Tax=Maridesulfovibrio ferrireducens TaxID=246191 RepID=A0A1G9ICT4_9BACT|nr:restriction endonuclease subunit S [Maridesulfovibrio ferrireducens]SDL23019.1 type I restriction enzyme, S subunit [Maridesulfovibrio ferrireducens]